MANKYEAMRENIRAALANNCVKVSEDASATSYNWSMNRAFTKAGEACQMDDVKNLPEDFKTIVRFELDKLRDLVMNNPKWALLKSRESWVFNSDGVNQHRADTFKNTALSLQEQLQGATVMLVKTEALLAKADRGTKRFQQLRRKANAIRGEQQFIREEIARQEALAAESRKDASKMEEKIKA
jgi:hypothetical protein